MKVFNNKLIQAILGYGIMFLVLIVCVFFFLKNAKLNDFITSMENRSFDLRQSILVNSKYKKASDDIVIVTIDDSSYEYLLGKYGEWPIPRDLYANLIYYLEKQNPKAIAFDLMFIKSLKSKTNADAALVKAIKSYDNVYTAMNFDNEEFDLRKPATLPNYLSVNVQNDSKRIDFSKDLTYINCRTILPQILNSTKNVGLINVSREDDGILRKIPPFMLYQNKFYPHLALKVGLKYLNEGNIKDYKIDQNSNIVLKNRTIPLDKDGGTILNWYGPANSTFKKIPLYKVIKAIESKSNDPVYDFKGKIVYIGTTAVSLYDIKSVPVDKLYPGVEVHATYINNLIDNNFIKRVDTTIDILISIIIAGLVGYIAFKTTSTFVALGSTILTGVGYIIFTYFMMKYFNLWLGIILPIASISLIFVTAYIIKYILKSRDFEHQYKLATTDGLTELYNHRYFQEQMILQVANCKRYNSNFSLILIDIDFFKKFNDTYGHQSGDAVLKQVAQKLKKNVRASDFVCRYGGEEMSIILPNTDKDEAVITAEKICQIIAEKPFKLANNQESNVTISVGVSTYPQNGETPAKLIEYADQCLYVAKENGRNQVRY